MSILRSLNVFQYLSPWLMLGVTMLIFLLCLGMSVQPLIIGNVSVLGYTHLICLFLIMLLSSNAMPLWLLFAVGMLIDSTHGQLLGSSSAIVLVIYTLFPLMSRSALRYSGVTSWLMFSAFLGVYACLQLWLQTVVRGLFVDPFLVLADVILSVVIFPVVFAVVLVVIKRFSPSGTVVL